MFASVTRTAHRAQVGRPMRTAFTQRNNVVSRLGWTVAHVTAPTIESPTRFQLFTSSRTLRRVLSSVVSQPSRVSSPFSALRVAITHLSGLGASVQSGTFSDCSNLVRIVSYPLTILFCALNSVRSLIFTKHGSRAISIFFSPLTRRFIRSFRILGSPFAGNCSAVYSVGNRTFGTPTAVIDINATRGWR